MKVLRVGYLRWCIHGILEEWKDGEDFLRNELKITVTQIIHKINVGNITSKGSYGCCVCNCCCV